MSCVPLSPKSQNPKALENERLVPPVDVVVVAIDGVVVVPVAVPLVGVDVVTEYGRIELPYAYSATAAIWGKNGDRACSTFPSAIPICACATSICGCRVTAKRSSGCKFIMRGAAGPVGGALDAGISLGRG
jgi:hypothetical protein